MLANYSINIWIIDIGIYLIPIAVQNQLFRPILFLFEMAKKLTQQQIDQLAADSDQQLPKSKDDQNYQEQFQHEVEDQYPQDQENKSNKKSMENSHHSLEQSYKLDNEPEIQSEIAQEEIDQMLSQNHQDGYKFNKDEDLSEAKSEFIESSKLKDDVLKIKSNIKKTNTKEIQNTQTKKASSNKKIDKKPQNNQTKQKIPLKIKKDVKISKPAKQQQKQPKKQKLTESEINRKLKQIAEQKKDIQKKKQQRKKKQQDIRRKQYEQAKQQEQQRKQKNKKIFQQQQKQKKKGQKKVQSKSNIKVEEEQIKIPVKNTNFQYMDMKKQRKMNEQQIQKKIEQQNLQKLKKLKEDRPKELKGEEKKAAILQERKYQEQRERKMKKIQNKQQDTLIIKSIKKQILQCKKFNLEKNQQINRAEKTIADLTKRIKQKQKLLYDDNPIEVQLKQDDFEDFSELSPIERFVYAFPQCKDVQQIFKYIDSNGDGVLSSEQIRDKLLEMKLDTEIIKKIEDVLDENCDGSVSHQQFVFFIEHQIQREKDFKKIMGEIETSNPLDLEAKILDMQTKMKFINNMLQKQKGLNDETPRQKIEKMENKIKKMENRIKKQITDYTKEEYSSQNTNVLANLTNQLMKLKNQKNIKTSFLEKLRSRVKDNLAEKNRLLAERVEESLNLEEQVYKIKNQIQEKQLRFLSMKKIEENKKGYLQRQTQKRKELQQAYKKAKEYQVQITNPTKAAQKTLLNDQLRLLAAVLMIQRNFRKRQARKQLQNRKIQNRK